MSSESILSSDNYECCICMETNVYFLIPPCTHKICEPCAVRIYDTAPNTKCPLCREPLPGGNYDAYTAKIYSSVLQNISPANIQTSFPGVCHYGTLLDVQRLLQHTGPSIVTSVNTRGQSGLWLAAKKWEN